MILTEKEQKAIQNMSVEKTIEVLNECKERLGLVKQKDYKKIMKYDKTRQNLRLDMISGKVKHLRFFGFRYPILND